MNNITFDIKCISNRPKEFYEFASSLSPYNAELFHGDGYPSFSKLVNDCICSIKTDYFIIANDKARPRPEDVELLISKLLSGYAFVGLYCFGFWGSHKDVFKRIGFLDEKNFIGGACEDSDFLMRLTEANLSYYYNKCISYKYMTSSWIGKGGDNNKEIFYKKWGGDFENPKRLSNFEEIYYNIGEDSGKKFLDKTYTHNLSWGK